MDEGFYAAILGALLESFRYGQRPRNAPPARRKFSIGAASGEPGADSVTTRDLLGRRPPGVHLRRPGAADAGGHCGGSVFACTFPTPFIHRRWRPYCDAGVALCAPRPSCDDRGAAAAHDVPAIFGSGADARSQPEVMAEHGGHSAGAASRRDSPPSKTMDLHERLGTSNVQLTFGSNAYNRRRARDVQEAIVAPHADLPSSLTRNPTYGKSTAPGSGSWPSP